MFLSQLRTKKNNKKTLLLIVSMLIWFPLTSFAEEQNLVKKTIVSQQDPLQSLVPMLLGLGVILLIIFVLASVLRKFSNFNLSSNQIKVIECQRLGAKEKLVIVKVQDKQLLLGVTPQNISPLTELEQPIENKPSGLSFDKLMKQFIGGHVPNAKQGASGSKEEAIEKSGGAN